MKVWKYYIDTTKSDVVLIEIKAGYKKSRVFYNQEYIGTIEGAEELKKGVLFDCSAGEVTVKTRKNRLEVMLNNRHATTSANNPFERISKYRTILWVALVLNSLTWIVLFSNPFLGGEYILMSNKTLYQTGVLILIIISVYLSKKGMIWGAILPLILYMVLSVELLYIYISRVNIEWIDWESFEVVTRGFRLDDLFHYLPHFVFKVLVIIFMAKSIRPFREQEEIEGNALRSDILDDFK